ncbi:hypothetical protein PHYSODRAFT_307883 [Phytophthora sojae]|uniref:Uncharacterized protein n=1 Tax=Phytophthora sojae (strain P6497) TaxID=1094619 RepID=G5AGP0_PHYSP|nr:hypothetical protein PHYSODRAFT_303497 [Phytophthora sojae]XP_009539241.1 hypothetical protein PHYSODRAFT_307883 [Phytophthora sojae]EGZ05320.1 hypothetical protein PHYSODRAFT_307883 [Phytophthora sojae]EGZ14331.1 hypothetical protein PHYSODRAFT_303497 [Phytophthora sojae]|eukprot:XP_009531760.1 hypothetical protein PHYSODRAFT_303497 [Phytophthora sojae]
MPQEASTKASKKTTERQSYTPAESAYSMVEGQRDRPARHSCASATAENKGTKEENNYYTRQNSDTRSAWERPGAFSTQETKATQAAGEENTDPEQDGIDPGPVLYEMVL